MLQDMLIGGYDAGGIDSTLATYAGLRDRYYGRFTYDFGEVPLVDVAGEVARRGVMSDAIRLLELNVAMNPESTFARTQLMTLVVNDAFISGGIDAGRQAYAGFRARFGDAAIPESLLNSVGYSLLRRGSVDAAVVAFQLNTEAYPRSGNVHDSLGEGLAAKGDVQGAIEAYERSLELDPGNQNAVQKLRELRGR
jgi:tetratricopeptide (TPR) repeat protein